MTTPFSPLESFGKVPDGWIWGTATAAHQIEGGNTNNDWWEWEHADGTRCAQSSGDACDSWHRWFEDLELVKRMGLDSYRFSLEWSRIEPAEGEFSLAALEHYRQILIAAHQLGLHTNVTFHHFTTPTWMAEQGGWENPLVVERFARYCDMAVKHLGDHIDMASTINEANIPGLVGYLIGDFPPGRVGDFDAFRTVQRNFAKAHQAARQVLRDGPGDFPVGLTLALSDVVVHPDGTWEGPGLREDEMPADAEMSEFGALMAGEFYAAAEGDDYLGVQTYFTQHLGPDGTPLDVPASERVTQMGWTFTPESLGRTVRSAAAATGLPIYVTENGVATADDAERIEYYSRSLGALREAMDDGVDVRGFYAWSLLDNFEWAHGYGPKFGLVEVDPVTFVRTIKPSGEWLARLAADSRE